MGAQAVRLSNIDIDRALEQRHFELLFQPIFDLSNGALARIETFVRWRHETLGLLPPGAFISFFETQGRMSELTRYVLERTLDSYLDWRGPYQPGFSINLALSDLTDETFVSHFTVLLREKNFPAELVTLECPMPPVTMERSTAIASFGRLADTGARLAIEIRGRANDFVRTLDPFPFAEIKTGGAAILRFARTVRGPGLSAISELLDLAKERNAAITAVGVEDQASLTALRGLNFDAAQGNHLGRVGLLKDFKLAMVNDVRSNLSLSELSKAELENLFRTQVPEASPAKEIIKESAEEAPKSPRTKPKAAAPEATEEAPTEEDLLDRLEERLSSQGNQTKTIEEDRKAAAIRRARMKQATSKATEEETTATEDAQAPRPHKLQERLSQEFGDQTEVDTDVASADDAPDTVTQNSAPDSKPEEQLKPDDEPEEAIDIEATDERETEKMASIAASDPSDDQVDATLEEVNDEPQEENTLATSEEAKPADDEEPASDSAPEQDAVSKAIPQPTRPLFIELGGISVKNAHAFFRPGVKVAGPEALSLEEIYADLQRETTLSTVTPSVPNIESESAVDEAETQSIDDDVVVAFTETDAPETDEVPIVEPVSDVTEEQISEQAFVAAVKKVDEQSDRRVAQKRNFLTRRYRFFSGYFWPKSWRQAWAEKEAEKRAAEIASFDD